VAASRLKQHMNVVHGRTAALLQHGQAAALLACGPSMEVVLEVAWGPAEI
jgi:hypothetical protein